MPLEFSDVKAWLLKILDDQGVTDFPPINRGPFVEAMPDQLCTLTLLSGGGLSAEGALNSPQFQVRVRSEQNDQTTAERQSNALFAAILAQSFPQTLESGATLNLCFPLGGDPSTLGPPDDAYRYDYVCNYYTVVGV